MNSSTVTAAHDILAADINNIRKDIVKNAGDYGTTTGSANTYALSLDSQYTAYVAGDTIKFKINVSNTGASTININTIGAKTLKRANVSDLVQNDLVANNVYEAIYDGTNFIITALTNEWTYLETITFSSESGTKNSSTFFDKTLASVYRIEIHAKSEATGTLGINVNGLGTSVYGWGNASKIAWPAIGGLSSGQGSCGIAYFPNSGESVSGNIYINAQKDSLNMLSFSGYVGGTGPTTAVFTSGQANIGTTETSLTQISIASGLIITGEFKIYRKNL